jgi:hypothetical protein
MLLQYSLTPQGKIGHPSNRNKNIQMMAKSSISKSILRDMFNVHTELFDEHFLCSCCEYRISRGPPTVTRAQQKVVKRQQFNTYLYK